MSITINLYYTGKNDNALNFVKEMENSGLADKIRLEEGNLKYKYFISYDDPETVLLIDSWANQAAIDKHHKSKMMLQLSQLRDKYDLHMKMKRYEELNSSKDSEFLRN